MSLKSYAATAAGLGLLALTLTLTPVREVAAQMKPILAEIVNTIENPVLVKDVDNGQQPWQGTRVVDVLSGSQASLQTVVTVPTGKRLVIESVSARVVVSTIDSISTLNFFTRTGNNNGFHEIQVSRQSDLTGRLVFAGTHAYRAYADADTVVQVQFERSDITNEAIAYITLVGYLVNVL
jgi:hypothetical protein